MATPIPAFVSQWYPSDSDFIEDSDHGSTVFLTTMFPNIWFYLASNRSTVANGMSLLKALELALIQSTGLGPGTWSVKLSTTAPFKVSFTNNTGSTTGISMSQSLISATGYDNTGNPFATGISDSGAGPSSLFWTPNMPVSMTGPQMFDPATQYGVPTSAGAVQRAPDMTASAVSNGVQWAAEYRFNGVDGYYKAREAGATSSHYRESFETWWQNGPALGRRLLMWRDRTNALNSNAPSEGSASPYNYVEYFPTDELRGNLLAQPMAPPNLTFWDIRVPLLVTENGETPLSD